MNDRCNCVLVVIYEKSIDYCIGLGGVGRKMNSGPMIVCVKPGKILCDIGMSGGDDHWPGWYSVPVLDR